jgi:hypothetical protein
MTEGNGFHHKNNMINITNIVIEHFRSCWTNYTAGSATISFGWLVNGQAIIQSLECGLAVFFTTYFLKLILDKFFKKKITK